jgi:hypothetical protein
MFDAADEVYVSFGIAPFDQAIPTIAGIILKHYKLRETAPERTREYLANLAKWVTEQKAIQARKESGNAN